MTNQNRKRNTDRNLISTCVTMYNFRSIAQRIIQNVQSLHCCASLVLRVLLRLKFSDDALQLPLSLALREVAHFVVSWSDFHQPEG